jgi:hypothetical protein
MLVHTSLTLFSIVFMTASILPVRTCLATLSVNPFIVRRGTFDGMAVLTSISHKTSATFWAIERTSPYWKAR